MILKDNSNTIQKQNNEMHIETKCSKPSTKACSSFRLVIFLQAVEVDIMVCKSAVTTFYDTY